MANYDNGANTRQFILHTAIGLFYEKGFDAVGYRDIYKAAHVNRSTVYYHFPTKDLLCYEALWTLYIQNKKTAERYCDKQEYVYPLALALQWHQIQQDPAMRRIQREICISHPVFTGKMDLSHFYTRLCEVLWAPFLDIKQIPPFSVASVYGYIISTLRLLCEYPETHNGLELLIFSMNSSAAIWGLPQKIVDDIWENVRHYFDQIPEEDRKIHLPPTKV